MGERSMKYIYGVQWIDHGGPYEEPCWENHVPTALKQMGLNPDIVIEEIGGFKLNNQPGSSGLFGFIKTNVELPKWGGMVKGSTRWVEDIQLWFYTFSVNEGNIVKQWTVQEFEEEIFMSDKENKTSHVTQADLDKATTKFMGAIHELTKPIPEDETEEQKKHRRAVGRALATIIDEYLWTDWK